MNLHGKAATQRFVQQGMSSAKLGGAVTLICACRHLLTNSLDLPQAQGIGSSAQPTYQAAHSDGHGIA